MNKWKKKKTSNEVSVQKKSVSDLDIQYLRQVADKSFAMNFGVVSLDTVNN